MQDRRYGFNHDNFYRDNARQFDHNNYDSEIFTI